MKNKHKFRMQPFSFVCMLLRKETYVYIYQHHYHYIQVNVDIVLFHNHITQEDVSNCKHCISMYVLFLTLYHKISKRF